MSERTLVPRVWAACCGLALLFSLAPHATWGETRLQWTLQTERGLVVQMKQKTDSQTRIGKQVLTLGLNTQVDLAWKVLDRSSQHMTIEQTLTRVRLSMASSNRQTINYDSEVPVDSPALTAGAKALAVQVRPLIGLQTTFEMTGRGEIREVKLRNSEAMKQRLQANPQLKALLSPETLSQAFSQAVAIFPEKPVAKGATWNRTSDRVTPLGKFSQTNRYEVSRLTDQVVEVGLQSQLKATPPAKGATGKGTTAKGTTAKVRIKTQTAGGKLTFDPKNGYAPRAELRQVLVMESRAKGLIVETRTESELSVSMTPQR